MFYEIRYQTGQVSEIIKDLNASKIPCLEVDSFDDFKRFSRSLEPHGFKFNEDIALDKKARDMVKEPEFEFRATFTKDSDNSNCYIDIYMEPIPDEDYAGIYGD